MPGTLAQRLAAFALGTRFEDLPAGVIVEARRRLLDSLGCAIGALSEPAPSIARKVASRIQGSPSVSLIGGGSAAPDWAAFSNGVHIRYLDCNDTYLSLEPAHPSDNWAAVMAVGQLAGASGKAWIAAAAAAYEVQCRLCDAASIRARGWDHTTYGAFSATLAAAMLLKLTADQTVHALGIAATTGTALRLTRAGELSMWKGCAFAHAARNGIFAALLAADGMTGPAPLFEGDMGFFQQVSGPFTLAKLGGSSAGDWMLTKTSIKFVPAEYHSQSAIAAAFDLRAGSATRRGSARSRSPPSARPSRSSARTPKSGVPKPERPPTIASPIAPRWPSSMEKSQPNSSLQSGCETRRYSTWFRGLGSSKTRGSPPVIPSGSPTGSPSRSTTDERSSRRLHFLPATIATHSPTPSSLSSFTISSTRSWASLAPLRSLNGSPDSKTTRPRTR